MAESDRQKSGYCKASWYEKDKHGDSQEVVHVVPRDWIRKDTKKIYWPPKSSVTTKKMIETMQPRPREKNILSKWQVFELATCSETFQSMSDAEALEIETAVDTDLSSESDKDSESGAEENILPPKRKTKRSTALDEYVSGHEYSDSLKSKEGKSNNITPPKPRGPVSKLIPTVGDMTASKSQLPGLHKKGVQTKAAVKSFSPNGDIETHSKKKKSERRQVESPPPLPTMYNDPNSEDDIEFLSPSPGSRALSPAGSQCSQRSQKRHADKDKLYDTVDVKKLMTNIHCEVKVRTFIRC